MISADVENVIQTYPEPAQRRIYRLREEILQVADAIPGVGELDETLKWGEPAYRPAKSRSGTTIRIAWKPKFPESCSLFVDCKTSLIGTFRTLFPELDCQGNREVRMPLTAAPPPVIRDCIALALTYKRPALLENGPFSRLSSRRN